jgi:hypothetical protein
MSTSDVVKETLNVAGLSTNIYARANLRNKRTSEPVVVLFFLHGRTDSADEADPTARAAFLWAAEKEASSKEASRDFMVVTFVRSHPTEVKWLLSTSSLRVGSTEPWQEDGGSTREPGMVQEGGSTQRTACASAQAASLLMQPVLLTSFTKFAQR